MNKQALKGLKVLGFVTDGVGPLTTRVLAMYGATVVQIESENRPDGTRLRSPYKDNIPGVNRSYRYVLTNPGKYGMCLNMKHPGSKIIAERLVKWADVVIDNFRPGVMAKWQLDYDHLRAIKPEIVAIGLSARGQTGPYRMAAGYGSEISGMTGFTGLTGWPDRNPVSVGVYTDSVIPHFAIVSILAAIDYRNRTGKGQYIDLSQTEAALKFLTPAILDYTANQRVQTRNGNKCAYAAPHGVYRCKGEDKWCAIAVYTDTEWEAFCRAIGNPAWTKDPRFSTLQDRKANEEELNRLVEQWTSQYEADEVMALMHKVGVKAGKLRTLGEVMEIDPQLKHRQHLQSVDQPEFGPIMQRGSSYRLSKTPFCVDLPAPCLGEHTQFVCQHFLGMSDEEFVTLYCDGVFT